MDIAGAKALKERLGHKKTDDASSGSADVPENAPPIYRWTGVSEVPPRHAGDEEPLAETASMFRRLGLSFR